MTDVSLDDVRGAAGRIAPFVVRTPLERSIELSDRCGVDVWLKYECFQLTGSFKLRGALNALQLLDSATTVVTASAGNHGLGVASAAARLNMSAIVLVPRTASQTKVDALRQSGAELIQVGETYDEAEEAAMHLAQSRGLPFISAYNDAAVIAGGGTVALEIFEDLPDVHTLIVPAGGGGLISGIGVAALGLEPKTTIYGVQSEASPALHAALAHGRLVQVEIRPSLADGLAGNVEAGSITFELIRQHVHRLELVSEAAIAEAMHWLLVHERVVVEGSAAVGVAALLGGQLRPQGPVAVVLTGRNVAQAVLRKYVHAPVRIPPV
ncbi:MAG: threonine/serine dehydratase [Chloroflexi bacterium]|nr:threonine/serine dehydratase [Chloroflexota bacterium]